MKKAHIIAAVVLVATTLPAAAKTPLVVTAPSRDLSRYVYPMQSVSYADLNLTTKSGQKTFMNRVDTAVEDICNQPVAPDDGIGSRIDCEHFAMSGVRPSIEKAFALAVAGDVSGAKLALSALAITAP